MKKRLLIYAHYYAPDVASTGQILQNLAEGMADKGDYDGFCTLVRETVPDHAKLPTAVELERMDVLSFSKPVALWDPTNAPVKGKRFLKYKKVGEAVMDMIALKL